MGRFPGDGDRLQLLEQRRTAAESATYMERVVRLVVLQNRSAVRAQGDVAEAKLVSRTAILDAFQDLVEVEARADRLFHLPKRLKLCDLAFQLGPSGLECAHQVDLPQHDRSLNGELFEEFALTIVEGRDVGTPHRKHADHLVLQQHRRGQQRAETGKPLQVGAAVVRRL